MSDDYLPKNNADGLPIVPMTDVQKYIFDLKGWICLPGLIDADQCAKIREHLYAFVEDPEQLPEEIRTAQAGPAEMLLDHPEVVGVCNEIIAHMYVADEDYYGFRYDHDYVSIRSAGHDNYRPHGGGGLLNFVGNSHIYQHRQGKVFAGLIRVVWELNEVRLGDGTMLMSGSHKTAFKRPKDDEVSGRDSPLWENYACPEGSVLIFTESLCHSGTTWSNEDWDRISIFTCYNSICSKWGEHRPSDAIFENYAPKRQSLFRGVWTGGSKGQNARMDLGNIAH